MKNLLALALLVAFAGGSLADSPLTSTNLHEAYGADLKRVLGSVDASPEAHVRALLDPHPTEVHAAVISHLGWNFDGQNNAQAYFDQLARRKESAPEMLGFEQLSARELFALGYLRAMDDYLNLQPMKPGAAGPRGESPAQLLARAAALAPEDFTIAFILSLVRAQDAMAGSFCAVWQNVSACLNAFPEARRNMRPAGVTQVMSYIGIYEKDCLSVKPAENPEMDQVYRLVPYKRFVVAGTQAGTVFWDAATRKVHSRHPDRIVTDVLVFGGDLWTASQLGLRRYDGTAWSTAVEHGPSQPACHLVVTREGLHAYRDQHWFRWEPAERTFQAVGPPSPLGDAIPYDVLERANGDLWAVEFGRGLISAGHRRPKSGAEYPGSDPRRLFEDHQKVLRVADFEQGFYRHDDATKRFVPEPSAGAKASAFASDPKSGRAFYLNYVDALLIREPGRPDRTIPLPELEYMRDLHVSPTGEVWVAGWGAITVLAPGTWTKTLLRSARN